MPSVPNTKKNKKKHAKRTRGDLERAGASSAEQDASHRTRTGSQGEDDEHVVGVQSHQHQEHPVAQLSFLPHEVHQSPSRAAGLPAHSHSQTQRHADNQASSSSSAATAATATASHHASTDDANVKRRRAQPASQNFWMEQLLLLTSEQIRQEKVQSQSTPSETQSAINLAHPQRPTKPAAHPSPTAPIQPNHPPTGSMPPPAPILQQAHHPAQMQMQTHRHEAEDKHEREQGHGHGHGHTHVHSHGQILPHPQSQVSTPPRHVASSQHHRQQQEQDQEQQSLPSALARMQPPLPSSPGAPASLPEQPSPPRSGSALAAASAGSPSAPAGAATPILLHNTLNLLSQPRHAPPNHFLSLANLSNRIPSNQRANLLSSAPRITNKEVQEMQKQGSILLTLSSFPYRVWMASAGATALLGDDVVGQTFFDLIVLDGCIRPTMVSCPTLYGIFSREDIVKFKVRKRNTTSHIFCQIEVLVVMQDAKTPQQGVSSYAVRLHPVNISIGMGMGAQRSNFTAAPGGSGNTGKHHAASER